MNQTQLRELRERLADRAAAAEGDHPLILWAAAVLWAFLLIVFSFV